jgi:HlyD family secretion protein
MLYRRAVGTREEEMKKRVIAAGIIVAVFVTAFLVSRFRNNRDEGSLLVSGNVEVTEANIGFKIPGRVVSLFVDEGQKVRKGDRLALLDRAELESLEAQNRAAVGFAEAELEKASKDYERAVKLIQSGAIPAQQMDVAKTALDVAESRLRQSRAAHAASRDRLRDTVLFAPLSGVILQKNVELGETVMAGTAVFSLGDLDDPWIKVYVKEDKLGLVKLGQKAEVRVDSFPAKVYEGTVTFISSEAEFTPKNVQTQEERVKLVFGAKVNVKNQNDELKPGMPADVKILLR